MISKLAYLFWQASGGKFPVPLESIAYQGADLLRAMEADAGRKLRELRVDGGAVGFWKDRDEIAALWSADRTFRPRAPAATTRRLLAEWHGAVARAKS